MMIKKTILHSLLYFMLTVANSQSVTSHRSIDFSTIQPEIEWFIDKTKGDSYKSGGYNVYLAKIFGENNLDYCVSMGYIQDSLWVSEIGDFKHYIALKDQLVLIQIPNHLIIKNNVGDQGIKLLTDNKLIAEKIYPGTVFLSTPPGYVCCFNNRNIVKVYYDNVDEMPYEKKIFKYIPQGETIKVDSSTMKQMFKKKKKSN